MRIFPTRTFTRWLFALVLVARAGLPPLPADVVETTGGSVIHGRIVASEGGIIRVETDFAGLIAIKQDQVKAIATDEAIHVALTDGHTMAGRISTTSGGVRVTSGSGGLVTPTLAISALWRDGDKSPAERAADALRRKWQYELAFDLNGRGGNSDRTFVGLSNRAVLEGATDRLIIRGNYSRAEENDTPTQDEAKVGLDYSSFFSARLSWYVRTELGYDHAKELDLRSQSAAGMGYTFLKKPEQRFEGRLGLSYRYEDFEPVTTPDFTSGGLDVGLLHSIDSPWGRLTQTVSFTPSFEDFGNYVLAHESALDLPVKGNKPWKVRVGIKTDYTSEPVPGREKLDWTYYTQLILTLK